MISKKLLFLYTEQIMDARKSPAFLKNINKFWAKDMWPPCSPDLNPLDFFVWAYLEKSACSKKHRN